ncbi:MAG: hypothetical protein HOJ35_03325 [Bdellovibrionales bacterium]|nr:hypothetical protein [Bdellovibrionales bacterium]
MALSFIVLGVSEPLFENDHFRYFFEGKLFLQGLNIYKFPPQNFFLGADTIFRENVGFPNVPSIYGPLAHVFHGTIFNLVGFNGAVILIKFLYLSMFLFLWKKHSSELLLLCIPFLTKEFFNSIHLDFFAVLFILKGVTQFQKQKYNNGLFLTFLSLLIKPTGFIALPLIFSYLYKKIRFKRLSIWAFLFILYACFVFSWPSISIFARSWHWNSGITSIIDLISPDLASWSALLAPLILYGFILVVHLKKGRWPIRNIRIELGLIFLIQLLFSQTVNSWYLVWPLSFFLFAGEKAPVIWISLIWPLCYAPWLADDTVIYYTLVFHLSGLLIFVYVLFQHLFNINFFKTTFNLILPFGRKIFTSNQ